jgi:hypothetical protein
MKLAKRRLYGNNRRPMSNVSSMMDLLFPAARRPVLAQL